MHLLSTPSRARRFFDRLAPLYDRINARLYRPEWLRLVRAAIAGPRVLDAGVGTGHTTEHLPKAVGLDLSAEMLRRAAYRGHLVRGDVLRAPFRGGTFDTIVFAGSFYYLPEPAEGFRTAASLLRPGGVVILLSPATRVLAPFVRVLSPARYGRLMSAAGLRLVRYERLNWAACLVVGERERT